MKTPCYIFDLDGTLCDVAHRRHFVSRQPKNWAAWHAGLPSDRPHGAVVAVFRALDRMDRDYAMFCVSGRSEEYRAASEEWLARHSIYPDGVFMRQAGDHRDDRVVKGEIADEIEREYEIAAVFDDRKRVLEMWQARGVYTFDVGQGTNDF
jgi:phosphoglycolate phosphatase-like HAD superfamily hydrolase